MLQQSDAIRHAHQLYDRLGTRAEAVAAQRAMEEKFANHHDAAEDWERIRRILQERRGPIQS
ncbi:MAG: hypothetical protein AAGF30_01645 [Pseudomonadota bacterium]